MIYAKKDPRIFSKSINLYQLFIMKSIINKKKEKY